MLKQTSITSLAVVVLAGLLAACGGNTVAPGTYSVKAGTASIIGLDNYTCGDIIAPYESQAANSTASTLQSDGWSQTNLVDPPLMASSQFTADMAVNGLFYFGHGNTGVVAFPGVCGSNLGDPPYSSPYYWGVGDIWV
jgi:hypothetical protein